MARDWERASIVIVDILDRMDKFGKNIATFPFCVTQEIRNGEPVWVVDIHVKVKNKTEFDISSEGATLSQALKGAYLGLNNEEGISAQAQRANQAFGVTV